MRIEYDNTRFNRALTKYFDTHYETFKSLCSVSDTNEILGGCGFLPVDSEGITYIYLLRLNVNWPSVELYKAMMRYPFLTLGAKRVIGKVHSQDAINIGLRLGGYLSSNGKEIIFERDHVLDLERTM